jgi:bisphosphoglycerate-independent phosphoglycerate mutase (AlkP superfamily)
MSDQATREVFVLAEFTDRDGTTHAKESVFTVVYETDRQRQAVNQLVHRGFITFDVKNAKRHTSTSTKKTAAKR